MKSNDMIQNRDEIRARMQQALKDNDTDGFYQAFDDMISYIGDDVRQRYEEQVGELKNEMDSRILSQRGVRQLTNKEHEYYQKLSNAMKAPNPKQALTDADLVMPKTIMNAVFDELQTSHPLLSRIEFISTTGLTEMIMNTNGYQEAAWGKLCDEIIKEISSGFKTVSMTFLKLSAFIPVCKAMLDLGPEWLDDYVRQVLYEALANGLEAGIVTGDGNDKPIGMVRQVGDGVTVKGGVYPEKAKIKVTDLSPDTVGNLLSLIAVDPNGKPRTVRDLLLLVNPQDYFQKVMPATTLMAPDGSYRNDVMPYPMTIIPTPSLERGNAVLGMGYKYFAGAGMAKEGRVEYSDEYHFLEDERVYLIKLYANGFPWRCILLHRALKNQCKLFLLPFYISFHKKEDTKECPHFTKLYIFLSIAVVAAVTASCSAVLTAGRIKGVFSLTVLPLSMERAISALGWPFGYFFVLTSLYPSKPSFTFQ